MYKRIASIFMIALLLAVGVLSAIPTSQVYAASDSFTANTNDARLNKTAAVGGGWAAVHDAADASNAVTDENTIYVSIYKDGANYACERATLEFDTSDIPDTSTITSAYIALYGSSKDNSASGVTTYLVLVDGSDIATPPVVADYGDLLDDTTEWGTSIGYSSWSTSGWNNLQLNSTGISNIDKSGTTKFGLRISTDIDNTTPDVGWDNFGWQSANNTNKPTLYVNYTDAIATNTASDVTGTTATLNGNLLAAATSRGFMWGGGFTPDSVHSAAAESSTSSIYGTGTDFNIQENTIEAWVKPDSSQINFTIFATNIYGITNGIEVKLDTVNDQVGYEYAGASDHFYTNSWIDCGLEVDEIYHLLFTWNDGILYLYINGELKTGRYTIWDNYTPVVDTYGDYIDCSGYSTTIYYGAYEDWAIGALNGGKNVYHGDIFEVRVYDRALTAAEALSNYHGNVTETDLLGEWLMDEMSGTTVADTLGDNDGTIDGFTWAYNEASEWHEDDAWGAGAYSHGVTSLSPETVYHYRAHATIGGSECYGSDVTFTTSGGVTGQTNAASNVGVTTARLNGTVTSLGDYDVTYVSFEYGTTTAYGTNTDEQTLTSASTFYESITGLTASTTYHFRAIFRYDGTSYYYGSDRTFTTTAVSNPTIETGDASSIGSTTATLQGTLTSMGSYDTVYLSFQYGTTDSYGSTTSEQTVTSTTGFTAGISGLSPSTTYHFRARVRYAAGSYVNGDDNTFTTNAASEPTEDFSIISSNAFTGYLESGDLLVTLEYVNNTSPYANTTDPTNYFVIQFLDTDGSTVLASTPMPAWGNKVGSIYLSANSATSISSGGAYYVKIIGTYADPPNQEYTLTSADWRGDNPIYIDKWCLNAAYDIESYYELSGDDALVVMITGRGEVLSNAGGALFVQGIPYLDIVRPQLFAYRDVYVAGEAYTGTNEYDANLDFEAEVGTDIYTDMTAFGGLFGVSGSTFAAFGLGLAVIVLFGIILGAGGVVAGGILSTFGLFMFGNEYGFLAIQWTLVVAFMLIWLAMAVFWWQHR